LGASFGYQPLFFEQEKHFIEYDANYSSYKYFDYYQHLDVRGNGFTGKFGVILRPIQILRFGLSYHLPVTFYIEEHYSTNITTQKGYYVPEFSSELISDYTIVTPGKLTGSVAVIIGKFFILDGDLEFVDYSSMRMKSENYSLQDENDKINQFYKDVLNFKIGSEVKLGSIYFRGGFVYNGSPFAETQLNSDAIRLTYSGGLGFRGSKYFFDISYQYSVYDELQNLYTVDIAGLYDSPSANIQNKTHRVTTTIGFRF